MNGHPTKMTSRRYLAIHKHFILYIHDTSNFHRCLCPPNYTDLLGGVRPWTRLHGRVRGDVVAGAQGEGRALDFVLVDITGLISARSWSDIFLGILMPAPKAEARGVLHVGRVVGIGGCNGNQS